MKKYILFISLFVAFSGCNKFLDVPPKGKMIPTELVDFENMLNSPKINYISETYILQYLSDDAYIPDMILPIFASLPSISNAYSFKSEIYSEVEIDELWNDSYNRIFTYNTIVDNVMECDGNLLVKQSIRAEAMLGRALEYFYLVNAFAPAYDANTAQTTFAVPLILKADINQTGIKRSSVAAIYKKITDDLLESIEYLPVKPKNSTFRGSKVAAKGLLARIGLYTNNYEMALDYATQVLETQNQLLDLNDYKIVNPDISIGRHNLPRAKENPECFYARTFPYQYGASGLVWASDELVAAYKEGDKRKDLFYSYYFEMMGSELPWLNYCAYVEYTVAPTVPEMLLTRAECYARRGGVDNCSKALIDLDRLRVNRFDSEQYVKFSSNDDIEILREVLNERRCELAFMGLRFFDQKRLNREEAFRRDYSRTIDGKVITLAPDSPIFVLPIWPKVLLMNPDLLK